MPRNTWSMFAAAVGLALVGVTWAMAGGPGTVPPTLLAQQSKGVGETIGDKVGDAVQSVKRGARAAGDTIQEDYNKVRTSVHDMGVHGRIYSRLHWDKELTNEAIEVEVKNGNAILRGRVASLHAKAKAVELARDTVGVDRIEDHLTVEPVKPAAAATPATKGEF